MSKENSGNDLDNNQTKRRRSQSKFNKDLPRYECFCLKQYLSYPALYLHMKNKHIDYFQTSKNGKKIEPTKMVEAYDPVEGFKIFKISLDPNAVSEYDKKEPLKIGSSNELYAQNPNQNNFYPGLANGVLFPDLSYPQNYPFDLQQGNKSQQAEPAIDLKELVIEQAISLFLQSIAKKSIKARQQTKLFFLIFIDCINKHYGQLNDKRTLNKEVSRYTREYNCQYAMNIISCFENVYLTQALKKEESSILFFLKHSNIMLAKNYMIVIQNLYSFLQNNTEKGNPQDFIGYQYDKESESQKQNKEQSQGEEYQSEQPSQQSEEADKEGIKRNDKSS